jgi:hypothetical protein
VIAASPSVAVEALRAFNGSTPDVIKVSGEPAGARV